MKTAFDDPAAPEFRAFAAAVVHELRTPLSALSAEVDIALRRERPAAAYREALQRIRRRVTELAEFSGDLAWLGLPPAPSSERGAASLESLLTSIVHRAAATEVVVDREIAGMRVQGDEQVLTRGLWLLVEHADRYRIPDAVVRLVVPQGSPADAQVTITIGATAPGFAAGAWECLRSGAASGVSAGDVLRLRAASRIVSEVGGALVAGAADGDGVTVRLRRE